MAERQTERSQSIPRLWPFKRLFYGWGIVGTSMVVLIAQVPMYGPVLSVFVKPIGDDLGWSRGEISLAFTLGTLVGFSVSSIVGAKIDRYGARVAVVSAGVVVTASLAGLALMQEVWQFWLLFGLGRTAALSGINLGTTVAVANWFVRKRGRAVSLLVIGLRGGQALFPLFITPIIILLSWRHAYATLAVIAFVFIVVPGWVFLRRRPEDLGLRPDGLPPEPETLAPYLNPPPPGEEAKREEPEASWTAREARRTPAFWLLAVATAVVVFVLTAVNLHAVASFQDRGIGGSVAGLFVFVFAGTAAVSAYSWGMLMDRIDVRWGSMLATFLSGRGHGAAHRRRQRCDGAGVRGRVRPRGRGVDDSADAPVRQLLWPGSSWSGPGRIAGGVRANRRRRTAHGGLSPDVHGELRVVVPAFPGVSRCRRPRAHPRKASDPAADCVAIGAGIRRAVYTRCDCS